MTIPVTAFTPHYNRQYVPHYNMVTEQMFNLISNQQNSN